jgi:hypothetical protein
LAKARHSRVLALPKARSLGVRLPGWRRSDDRTRLHANSLLTGNFTGNFAISGLPAPIPERETAVLQPLVEQFPGQNIREKIAENRECFADNREFHLQNRKRPFLTHLSL